MKVTLRKMAVRGEKRWVVDWTVTSGRRQRRFFNTKSEAEAEAASLKVQHLRSGDVWMALTADQRNELVSVFNEVDAAGRTLRDVWMGFRQLAGNSRPVERRMLNQCIEETLRAKREGRRRESYLASLEHYLRTFARGRGQAWIDEIRVGDIEEWFASRPEAAVTRASNLGRLSAMFDLAWRRGYIRENPCRRVERVHVEARPPQILTVRQAAKILVRVKRRHPRGLAWFALALMAGIRPEECDRLNWANIDLDAGIVTIDAAASKVRRRRIVHLQPAAAAWLRLARSFGADLPLPKVTRRRYLRAIREKMGWARWPQDILRHTCASFLMAVWQDAGRVANELGNSAGILLRHYRELVRREEAERFWRLIPRNPSSSGTKP